MNVSIACNIKQENFQSGIFSFLESFRKEKHFLDVSLNCKDGEVQAHRIVLSLYSPYFYDKLKENTNSLSTISLENVPLNIMEALLKFMYEGEANLDISLIHEFLKIGHELKISGFPSNEEKEKNNTSPISNETQVTADEDEDVKKTSIVSVDEGFEFEPNVISDRTDFELDSNGLHRSPSETSYVEDEEDNESRSSLQESPQFLDFQVRSSRKVSVFQE